MKLQMSEMFKHMFLIKKQIFVHETSSKPDNNIGLYVSTYYTDVRAQTEDNDED